MKDDMKIKHRLVLAALILITFTGLISLWHFNTKYTGKTDIAYQSREANSQGSNYRIPVIEKSWIIHKRDSFHIYYAERNRSVNRLNPYHLYKDIFLKNGNPTLEKDAFHYQIDDLKAYRLISEFNWLDHTFHYKFLVYNLNDNVAVSAKDISKDSYDSTLVKWKINPY